MKPIFKLLYCAMLCLSFNLKAQTPLENAIQKLNSINNISYTSTRVTKEFFSDDLSKDTLYARLSNTVVDDKNVELFDFSTKGNEIVFNGSYIMRLNNKEKTYTISHKFDLSLYQNESLFGWLKRMKDFNVTKHKIKNLADTILHKIPCYHIKLTRADTIINKERQYAIYDIYLSKLTLLPLKIINDSRGIISKGGYEAGIVTYRQEQVFTNYKINDKAFADLSEFKIPANYSPEKDDVEKPMLQKGTDAPEWSLTNTSGKILSSKTLKGKIVLIDFTANSCVACILAVPTMNKLHQKYANTNVEVVSINSWDKKEAVTKFIKQQKVTYPIYVSPLKLKEQYNVSSIPTFYIIDKEGKVAAAFSGFSDKLEEQLISKIEELNK